METVLIETAHMKTVLIEPVPVEKTAEKNTELDDIKNKNVYVFVENTNKKYKYTNIHVLFLFLWICNPHTNRTIISHKL